MSVLMWMQRKRFPWIYGELELANAAIEVVQKELEVVVGGRMTRASLDLG